MSKEREYYSQILEYFVRNNIQLSEDQVKALQEKTLKSITSGNPVLNKIKDAYNGDNVPVRADSIDISNRAESLLQKFEINKYFSFNGDEFRFHQATFIKDFNRDNADKSDEEKEESLVSFIQDKVTKFVSAFNHSIKKFGGDHYTIDYDYKDGEPEIRIHKEKKIKALKEASQSGLSNDQLQEICDQLNKNYANKFKSIVNISLNQFKELKNNIYFSPEFGKYTDDYDDSDDIPKLCIYLYDYAYNIGRNIEKNEQIKLVKQWISDVNKFSSILSKTTQSQLGKKLFYIKNNIKRDSELILDCINQQGFVPSNGSIIYIIPTDSLIKTLTPSENQINEKKKQRYIELFKKFKQFLKQPFRLKGNSFTINHIADICRLIGMSTDQLNSMVSKNFKPFEKISIIKGSWFNDMNDSDFDFCGREFYIIDNWGEGGVGYFPKVKKMYWFGFEHNDFEEFYNNWPYNSQEFEDALYGDDELKKQLIDLYNSIK